MKISQLQFNHIIDLLGDYLFVSRFNFSNPLKPKTKGKDFFDEDYGEYIDLNEADTTIEDIQNARTAYHQALSELYNDESIPSVFTTLQVVGNLGSNRTENDWWGSEFVEKSRIYISIDKISEKLNKDFNSTDNEEENIPFEYTGARYKSSLENSISVGVLIRTSNAENMPKTNFYFVMSVLSDPDMLFMAAVLLVASCGFFLPGGIFTAGVITTAASLGIVSCYVARKLGFFREYPQAAIDMLCSNDPSRPAEGTFLTTIEPFSTDAP